MLKLSTLGWAVAAAALASVAVAQPPNPPVMGMNAAAAPAGHYKLDESHSSLLTRTRHLSAGYVVFRFNKFDGVLDWDPVDVAKSKVTINIDPKSIDNPVAHAPGGGTFAQLIIGPAWLDAFTYNKATFVSTRVTRKDASHGVIDGALTLRGVTKPVALDTEFLAAGADGKTPTVAFKAHGSINRRDFGLNASTNDMVSDKVDLVIDVEFNKEG